jgi:argininosuccinate lyase
LFPHDIAGSIAHARAQKNAGLLTEEEFSQIEAACWKSRRTSSAGNFEFKTSLEDIHMNIEAELTRRIGPAGAKLHTARSRNDQVATDTRLYCRTEIDGLMLEITGLQRAPLLDRAEKYAATVMPGYTHLQRGQPVTAATISSPTSRCSSATNPASPIAANASTSPRSARARSPVPPSISTATPSPPNSASTA